jgi:hypothetical protein
VCIWFLQSLTNREHTVQYSTVQYSTVLLQRKWQLDNAAYGTVRYSTGILPHNNNRRRTYTSETEEYGSSSRMSSNDDTIRTHQNDDPSSPSSSLMQSPSLSPSPSASASIYPLEYLFKHTNTFTLPLPLPFHPFSHNPDHDIEYTIIHSPIPLLPISRSTDESLYDDIEISEQFIRRIEERFQYRIQSIRHAFHKEMMYMTQHKKALERE